MDESSEILKPSLRNLITSLFGSIFFALFFVILSGNLLQFFIIANWLISLLLFIVFAAGLLIISYLSLINTWAEIKENGVFIQRGILAKSKTLLLYSQIQDVKEEQSLIEMILGLKRLTFVTMTGLSQISGTLPGMSIENADRLKVIVTKEMLKPQKETTSNVSTVQETETEIIKEPFKIQIGNYFMKILSIAIILFVIISAGIAIYFGLNNIFSSLAIILTLFFILIALMGILGINLALSVGTVQYFISKNRIQIQFGLFSITKISIPFDKVQDIVLRQGVVERLAGLASIKIETGSLDTVVGENSYYVVNAVPLLLKSEAIELRNFILKTQNYRVVESTPALVEENPLENNFVIKNTIGTVFGIVIFYISIFVLFYIIYPDKNVFIEHFGTLALVGAAVLLISSVVFYIYSLLDLKSYYFNFTQDLVIVRRGVITIKEIILPFKKIQNIFVDQDIFDRMLGLHDLHVSTAGFRTDMEVHIDGLNPGNAAVIKSMLMEKIKSK